jgi:O-antigen/teichoic acid export membrane protein
MNVMSVRSATAWAFGAQYAAFAVQFATSIVLARWFIGPADLGLFSIAFAAISLLTFLQDFGVTRYITGERDLTETKIRSVFTLSLGIAWTLALAAVLSAWPIAAFYELPGLFEVMLVIASSYFIGPLAIVPRALCQRRLDFRANAQIELGSCLLNAGVSLVLAFKGHGAMALAWGAFSQQAGRFAICLLVTRPVWFRPIWPSNVKPIAEIGGTNTVLAVGGSLTSQAPELVIGRLLGMAAVGLFARASGLAGQLRQLVTGAVSSVFFPALRQVRDSGEPLGPAYLRVVAAYTAITWAAMAGIAVLSEPIIRMLYGEQWTSAASLLGWIALAQICYCAVPLNADLPILLDRKRALLKLSLFDAVFSIGLLIAAAPFGVEWIAASRLLHGLVWIAIYLPFTCRLIDLNRGALWQVYRTSLIATLAAIAPALALYAMWQDQHAAGWGQALVAALLGALLWLVSLFALRHPLCGDITGIAGDIRKSLTPRLSRIWR